MTFILFNNRFSNLTSTEGGSVLASNNLVDLRIIIHSSDFESINSKGNGGIISFDDRDSKDPN